MNNLAQVTQRKCTNIMFKSGKFESKPSTVNYNNKQFSVQELLGIYFWEIGLNKN